jgi:hypothetical protein
VEQVAEVVPEIGKLDEEELDTWTVPPLLLFKKGEVKLPLLLFNAEDASFPIEFTGHLPDLGKFMTEDKE